uniref:Uncharacterized protein n=1 Tax=Laticauda laticaudata TaxID=8630 RepID=A0A8C5WSL8_LATLA
MFHLRTEMLGSVVVISQGLPVFFLLFYDTSKQAIGALFIHFANVFLSDLTEKDPCSLYLMNFILDATLGMLLIWLGVKTVSWIVAWCQCSYLVFGEYGDPPQATAWIGQCFLYLLIMIFEKTAVSLILLIPGWTKMHWSNIQTFLSGFLPSPFKAVMFWVVDSLTMKKHKGKEKLEVSVAEYPEGLKDDDVQVRKNSRWLQETNVVSCTPSFEEPLLMIALWKHLFTESVFSFRLF